MPPAELPRITAWASLAKIKAADAAASRPVTGRRSFAIAVWRLCRMEPLVPSLLSCSSPRGSPSSFILSKARSKLVPEYFCGRPDPFEIQGEGRDTGQPAATRGIPWARGPADHPDDGGAALGCGENRAAGVSRAGAEPSALAAGRG